MAAGQTYAAPNPSSLRIPDIRSLFESIDQVSTSENPNNQHSIPTPGNLSAVFDRVADFYDTIGNQTAQGNDVASAMSEMLLSFTDQPPRKIEGCPQSFLDELERVPKKSLKPTDTCPICTMPFLDDEFPLVVELSCHKTHRFDLDCIAPWLKLQTTCPLDRKDVMKKEVVVTKAEDDEEEWDDMYA